MEHKIKIQLQSKIEPVEQDSIEKEMKMAESQEKYTPFSISVFKRNNSAAEKNRLYRQRLREKQVGGSNSSTDSSMTRPRALTSTERSRLHRKKKLKKNSSLSTTVLINPSTSVTTSNKPPSSWQAENKDSVITSQRSHVDETRNDILHDKIQEMKMAESQDKYTPFSISIYERKNQEPNHVLLHKKYLKDTPAAKKMRLYRQRLREKKVGGSNSSTDSSMTRPRALTSTERSKLHYHRKKQLKKNSSLPTTVLINPDSVTTSNKPTSSWQAENKDSVITSQRSHVDETRNDILQKISTTASEQPSMLAKNHLTDDIKNYVKQIKLEECDLNDFDNTEVQIKLEKIDWNEFEQTEVNIEETSLPTLNNSSHFGETICKEEIILPDEWI